MQITSKEITPQLSNLQEAERLSSTQHHFAQNLMDDRTQRITTFAEGAFNFHCSPDSKVIITRSNVLKPGFNPYLIVENTNDTVRVWNFQGKLLKKLPMLPHRKEDRYVRFSPEGNTVAIASLVAYIWKIGTEQIANLSTKDDYIYDIAFSPDGKMVAAVFVEYFVCIYNLEGEGITLLRKQGSQECFRQVFFSPDSKIIATLTLEGVLSLWNLRGEILAEHKVHVDSSYYTYSSERTTFTFSPDSKMIITASGRIRFLTLQGEEILSLPEEIPHYDKQMLFFDGSTLALHGRTDALIGHHDMHLWDIQELDGQLIVKPIGRGCWNHCVHVFENAQLFVNYSWDDISIWNFRGEQITILQGYSHTILFASAPNGQFFAAGDKDGTLFLWNRQGEKIKELRIVNGCCKESYPDGSICSLAFSPDGSSIITIALVEGVQKIFVWNFLPELSR